MKLRKLWLFIKLTRPIFLVGGMMLYLLGTALALKEGASFHLARFMTGQFLVTAIQLMTHYGNEYYDQHADSLNDEGRTWFSGGSGVLVEGALSPGLVWRAAKIFALLAVIMLIVAGMQVPIMFLLGALSLLTAWFYSAPPLSLVSTGWGELSASLVVAGLVPLVGYTMQVASISPVLLMICLPLVCIHLAMLVAFQVPDWKADRQAGKQTLSVRLGLRAAGRIHNLALGLGFGLLFIMGVNNWHGAKFTWLAIPLALWQGVRIRQYIEARSRRYLWLTMPAVGLFALTVGLWLTGIVFY